MSQRQPIFNVPGVVLWLLASFAAVHLLLWSLPAEDGEWLTVVLAFIPARLAAADGSIPGGHLAAVTSFLTHQFVHGNLPHLFLNSAWLLAFGSPIARRTDPLRFMVFFLMCGVAGALLYVAFNGEDRIAVVGASGAISGLMGAAFRFIFTNPSDDRMSGLASAPLLPLGQTLRDKRILLVIVGWTVLNVLLALSGVGLAEAAGIAWEAHLGGFYAGLLLYGFFDRLSAVGEDAAPPE